MNQTTWNILSFITFLAMLFLSIALQTSIFHWILGWKTSLQIAIVILVYISLHRNTVEALLFIIIGSYTMGLFSSMLESMAVFAGIGLLFSVRAIKVRFYSPSSTWFTGIAVAGILYFHLVTWLISILMESKSPKPNPLQWLLEICLTALVTKALYAVFIWIDQRTKRMAISELES